jgi:hypothetical protein
VQLEVLQLRADAGRVGRLVGRHVHRRVRVRVAP